MAKDVGNFQEGIHATNYWDLYLTKLIKNSDITTISRKTESLNGLWQYGIDQYDSCLRNKWFEEKKFDEDGRAFPLDYSFETWETMPIPSSWNIHNDKLFLYEGSMVFTREFSYENHGEERVFIKFGATNYRAIIIVNQTYLGTHIGGSTPFTVEITHLLKKQNRILVVVNNTRRPENIPMDNTDWFNYGGIYRDVEIIRLPKNFIKHYSVQLIPNSNFKEISASLIVDGTKSVVAKLRIPELNITTEIPITNGKGEITISANPNLWSPDSPKLYDVALEFEGDKITDKIGFREIKVSERNILLNGKEIFLKGISCHEESKLNGKAVSEDEIRENYAIAKEMGCNFMRLAHYPHTAKAAMIADEVGLLLWEEIPVYWAIQFDNPTTYADAENQLTELINRDNNRASVIIWGVGNENADTDSRLNFMGKLADKAHELDKTRLVSAACLVDLVELRINDRLAEKIDVIGINEYYGWYEPDFSRLPRIFTNSNPQKPVIITEFGADALCHNHGTFDEMYTEENQLHIYQQQIATLSKIEYIKGMSPWILFDFRCPRRLHTKQNYYNIKGLVSTDKKHKKLAYYAMQKFYNTKG
ncbi:MAG: glycoside hydrolase family 2 [Alphaproteobacteria bacterium]|jgi:beta-glucuronidase|nr:glycoside hydrolase family 2 [Alphaproteobacteria bacterium]